MKVKALAKRELTIPIRYTFPTWLAARALTISGTSCNLSGYESSWAIRMPVYVSGSSPVWFAIRDRNIDYLRREISNGLKPHMMVDHLGQSPFHVSISQIACVYLSLGTGYCFDHRRLEIKRSKHTHNPLSPQAAIMNQYKYAGFSPLRRR